MELKEVYEKLEQMENGKDYIDVIKGEITKLNGEAKKHREAGEKSSAKTKSILENLGLEDADDVADKVRELKTTLDAFQQGKKTPTEVAKQMTAMESQLKALTKQFEDANNSAKAEKEKRLEILKTSAIVDALTKGKAASPSDMAKLIADKFYLDENENIAYKDGEKVMSVEEGVNAWLDANKWAVKVGGGSNGSGARGGQGNQDQDAFLAGFNSK